jgi:hypothetical protein
MGGCALLEFLRLSIGLSTEYSVLLSDQRKDSTAIITSFIHLFI